MQASYSLVFTVIITMTGALLYGAPPEPDLPETGAGDPARAGLERAASDGIADAVFTNEVLTLPKALSLALLHNPELNSAQLESQASEGRVTQAAARLNPAFSFEAENFGGRQELKQFETAEYTAQIEQAFELGGKRGKRIQVATSERRLTGFDLETRQLDIRAETRRRFVGVLGAQARTGLARETVALAEGFVKAVAARVGAGKVSPMELEKAHVLLAQKRIALEQSQTDLQTARIQLAAQWGSARPMFECAAGDLPAVPAIPPLPDLMSRLSGNPDVARWAIEIERSQAVLARAMAARVPDLTVGAGIRHFSDTDSEAFVAGVSLPLPLFDRNQGGIREAQSLLAKAKQQQRAAEVKAAADLATTRRLFATAANRASALKDDVLPRVKTVFDAFQSGYTQGKYSYLEILDAQRTLVESQSEYIDALITAQTALADLERIAGGQLQVQNQN